jgi:hypothetical protein
MALLCPLFSTLFIVQEMLTRLLDLSGGDRRGIDQAIVDRFVCDLVGANGPGGEQIDRVAANLLMVANALAVLVDGGCDDDDVDDVLLSLNEVNTRPRPAPACPFPDFLRVPLKALQRGGTSSVIEEHVRLCAEAMAHLGGLSFFILRPPIEPKLELVLRDYSPRELVFPEARRGLAVLLSNAVVALQAALAADARPVPLEG